MTTSNLEIEFKNMLTFDEYQQLLNFFQVDEAMAFTQTNLYYDTKDATLKSANIGLRIRLLADQAEMTLKTPAEEHLLETTVPLSANEVSLLLAQSPLILPPVILEQLAKFDIHQPAVVSIGSQRTKRVETKQPQGLFVLDESHYGTVTDYELELEVDNAKTGEADFLAFLKDQNIPRRPAQNKIQRMLANNSSHER